MITPGHLARRPKELDLLCLHERNRTSTICIKQVLDSCDRKANRERVIVDIGNHGLRSAHLTPEFLNPRAYVGNGHGTSPADQS